MKMPNGVLLVRGIFLGTIILGKEVKIELLCGRNESKKWHVRGRKCKQISRAMVAPLAVAHPHLEALRNNFHRLGILIDCCSPSFINKWKYLYIIYILIDQRKKIYMWPFPFSYSSQRFWFYRCYRCVM